MTGMDASLSLSLRIKTLETLIGKQTNSQSKTQAQLLLEDETTTSSNGDRQKSIFERATLINQNLRDAVKGDDAITSFLQNYPKNAPYLAPSFFLPSQNQSTSTSTSSNPQDPFLLTNLLTNPFSISPNELDPLTQFSLLLESESDLRGLENQLSECKILLEERKVLETQSLEKHFELKPKLKEIKGDFNEKEKELIEIERRLEVVLNNYGKWVDSLSKLFITWDLALNDMELKVSQEERKKKRKEG